MSADQATPSEAAQPPVVEHRFGGWEHAGPLMHGYVKRHCLCGCGSFQARRRESALAKWIEAKL
jgi:hypothetical protein